MLEKNGSIRDRYDERQQLVRGRGYKYAFWVLGLYDIGYILADLAFETKVMDDSVAIYLGICLAITVYASYCIWNEGYLGINDKPIRSIFVFSVIAAINLCAGLRHIYKGNFFTDGRLGPASINIFCGIMLGVIVIEIFVKWMLERKEED